MNRLEQLQDAGVSIWLDTLSRELLDSGAFAGLIADSAATGATSNADISGCAGDDSTISSQPLWWPPNKLSGRYLLPYLSRQSGEDADVMP